MSCCGKHRAASAAPPPRIPAATAGNAAPPPRHSRVFFEYVGRTGLTIVGPVSGRRYRFDAPGSRQPVDPADKPSLAAVHVLRQVPGP